MEEEKKEKKNSRKIHLQISVVPDLTILPISNVVLRTLLLSTISNHFCKMNSITVGDKYLDILKYLPTP